MQMNRKIEIMEIAMRRALGQPSSKIQLTPEEREKRIYELEKKLGVIDLREENEKLKEENQRLTKELEVATANGNK